MDFFKKIKIKTIAIGVLVVGSSIYGGKKLIEHIQCINNKTKPITDMEIRNELGIGTNVYYDEQETDT